MSFSSIDLRTQGVPGVLVCGAKSPIFRKTLGARILCVDTGNLYIESFSEKDKKALEFAIEGRVAELAKRGLNPSPGPLKRVKHVVCKSEGEHSPEMILYLEDTDYLEFLATNHNEKSSIFQKERRGGKLVALEHSRLANPLTVTVTLLTADAHLLLQQRNIALAGHARYPWQASFAGMISPETDYREGSIDPYAAAAREGKEELGLDISPEEISFFGLAREAKHLEVGLVGQIQVPLSRSEVERVIRLAPMEVSGIEFLNLKDGSVQRFLESHVRRELVVPLASIALLLSAQLASDV